MSLRRATHVTAAMQIKNYAIGLLLYRPNPLSANSIAHAFDGSAAQTHGAQERRLAKDPSRPQHHSGRIVARPSFDHPTHHSGYDSRAYAGHFSVYIDFLRVSVKL